jgi:hypothetical protein
MHRQVQFALCCDLTATVYVAAPIWRETSFVAGNWEVENFATADRSTREAEHKGSVLQQSSVLQRDFLAVLVHTFKAVLRGDFSAVASPACLCHIRSCHSTSVSIWMWSMEPPDHLTPTA